MIMIQDALSKAREQGDAGFVEKGTVFVREIVSDTIQSATRSLKIGLLLTGAALVVLAFALGFNVWKTRQTVERVTRAADESVQGVRKELGSRVDEMRDRARRPRRRVGRGRPEDRRAGEDRGREPARPSPSSAPASPTPTRGGRTSRGGCSGP